MIRHHNRFWSVFAMIPVMQLFFISMVEGTWQGRVCCFDLSMDWDESASVAGP